VDLAVKDAEAAGWRRRVDGYQPRHRLAGFGDDRFLARCRRVEETR
jgi:hypothetical protein